MKARRLVWMAVATLGLGAGGARAATPTDVPPVYQAHDAIDEGPARLDGDDAGLRIEHGVLSGRLERGNYRVAIDKTGARGRGPMGPVDVKITRRGDGFEVAGVWNGGDLHFVIGPREIRGSAMKQISDEDRGFESCRYTIDKLPKGPGYSGLAECLGQQPLRFEVQPRATSDLSDEENVILLVAYFAAPPAVWNP